MKRFDYAELFCKSNFSFLRGASDSREYIQRAHEIGISAIGITDVNGVYALPRAFEVLKLKPEINVKLICGAQLVIEAHPPITFLAQNRSAYGLLCRIITQAHAEKQRGEGCLKLSELMSFMGSHSGARHLIAVPTLTQDTNIELLKTVFDKNLYFPLCKYLDGMDQERIESTFTAAKTFDVQVVASNDVHYHLPQRRHLQDCLTCIREHTSLRKAGFHLFGNSERYLKSPAQMAALFSDMPDLILNGLEVAESCTFRMSELKYTYPKEFLPVGYTSQQYLEECVFKNAQEVYRGLIPLKVDEQIRHELKMIGKLDYADYFLTIYDLVEFARSQNILCQGRGSAANSIVCYVLGITSVDPVQSNLLFERFISEERAEPPDIDVDFEHERREEVIQYIYQRYGRERSAMVSAVRTYRKRSAFLELSKAIGIEVGTMSAEVLDRNFSRVAGADQDKRGLIDDMVEDLKGFPRHLSIHSGGFVLSESPLTEIVPVEPARMENRTIVQWDKNDLETLGLMKVDVLALGFLTAIHKIANYTGRNWRDIPPNDEPTYQMIRRAQTHGTFQIESRAQQAMLPRSQPQSFYDLVVQVAIVRPGPNVGNMVKPYLERREGSRMGRPYRLPAPDIEPILGRTYGVPIFQEQVMKLAIAKAGFSPGEADQLRRALAAWRSAQDVAAMGDRLYEGLIKNGVPKGYADELFTYIKGYAHYGFPESHAASFASIAYKSAFYKRHYPAEFLCGLINSQPMGFYPIDTLINEAKRNGVVVLPIDPNYSDWDATLTPEKAVRMGFRNVRGIDRLSVDQMIAERNKRHFISTEDFIARTSLSGRVITTMSMADIFACFGMDQRHSFWKSIEFRNLMSNEIQGNLFGGKYKNRPHLHLLTKNPPQQQLFAEMTLFEEIVSDYRSTGYSLRGNIMRGIRIENPNLPKTTSRNLKMMNRGDQVRLCGVLSMIQRPPTAKGVAFITLEDEFGSMDFIAKKEIYEAYVSIIKSSRFLIIEGKVQIAGRDPSLMIGRSVLISKVESFREATAAKPLGPGQHARELKAADLE